MTTDVGQYNTVDENMLIIISLISVLEKNLKHYFVLTGFVKYRILKQLLMNLTKSFFFFFPFFT